MPISSYRHEECAKLAKDEKPWYIVEMDNKDMNTKRLDTVFMAGVARTRSREKAQRFSEEFGYKVVLPTGADKWAEFVSSDVPKGQEYETEDGVVIVND